MSEAAAESAAPPKPKKPLPLGMIMVALNTLVILAGVGVIYVTKIKPPKRAAITEAQERERLEKQHTAQVAGLKPGFLHFETMTVNLKTEKAQGDADERLRYLTVSFSLELREEAKLAEIEPLKQRIIDLALSMLGRKSFDEMVTVQGRYLLRTEIGDAVNEMILADQARRKKPEDPFVTNVFFNQFTVQ